MKSNVERQEQGEERNAAWRSLSPSEQLADLDRRLGKGVGAKRQRALIADELESASTPTKSKLQRGVVPLPFAGAR